MTEQLLRQMNARQFDGFVMVPQHMHGKLTFTFTRDCEIDRFLYEHPLRELNYELWSLMIGTSTRTVKRVMRTLRDDTDAIPELVRNPLRFSFRDGVYDAKLNEFIEIDVATAEFERGLVGRDEVASAVYIDTFFPQELKDTADPLSIPTELDPVVNALGGDTVRVLGLVGRLLRAPRDLKRILRVDPIDRMSKDEKSIITSVLFTIHNPDDVPPILRVPDIFAPDLGLFRRLHDDRAAILLKINLCYVMCCRRGADATFFPAEDAPP